MPDSADAFLATFADTPAPVQALLRKIPLQAGVLPAADAAAIIQAMGFADVGPLMMMLLPGAAAYARVPVSRFRVGAVAAGMGSPVPDLYLGANLEFPGQALSFTVHAEQCAVNNAWLHGETGLRFIAVSAAPCGYCRQFLHELATGQSLAVLLHQPDTLSPNSRLLPYFLPEAFGPRNLAVEGGLMQPQSNIVVLASSDSAVQSAIAAAENCYAPYTNNFAGAALMAASGAIYAGRYAENAAYNPSMSPLESAFAAMNMALAPQSPLPIRRAVLVEAPTAASQRDATMAVLASIAPGITLEYFAA